MLSRSSERLRRRTDFLLDFGRMKGYIMSSLYLLKYQCRAALIMISQKCGSCLRQLKWSVYILSSQKILPIGYFCMFCFVWQSGITVIYWYVQQHSEIRKIVVSSELLQRFICFTYCLMSWTNALIFFGNLSRILKQRYDIS